jgi:hypothetical protein
MQSRKIRAEDVRAGMVLSVSGQRAVVSKVTTSSGTTLIELVGSAPLVFHPTRKVTVVDAPR